MNTKPQILTFTSIYLPGYKGGGPIRTIASMVDMLGDDFNFKILALDRDLGSDAPYPGIKVGEWQQVGKAMVYYVSASALTCNFLRNFINSTPHEILYLNSCFSLKYSIIPLLLKRFGLVNSAATVVAPRGEFSKGALNLKYYKKRSFLSFAMLIRLYKNVVWQASSQFEQDDILNIFSQERLSTDTSRIAIAPNLSQQPKSVVCLNKESKEKGKIKIVFISRISPKKNLYGALKMLQCIKGEVLFDIYGPIENMDYWRKCENIIEKLPASIRVQYNGMVSHDKVVDIFHRHDLFLFPTLGENFGHVIVEALVAGCPILISDQTPWKNLESAGVGWDIPLERMEKFTAILQQCVDMDDAQMQQLSKNATDYGIQKVQNPETVKQNRELFTSILEKRS